MNCSSDCVLTFLNSNIALTGCEKLKLSKHKLAIRKLVDRQVPLPWKELLIVQSAGFLLPFLASVLPTFANLIAAK